MLVDRNVFCGSENIADPYTSDRYGDHSFRDLSIVLRNQDVKGVRLFFSDILSMNKEQLPAGFDCEAFFNRLDRKDETIDVSEADLRAAREEMRYKFLSEMPPKGKTEVTDNLLEIINKAEKSIKII